MSDELYVPTLSDAQSVYVLGRATTRRSLTGERAVDVTPYSAEFDRFVAKIKADAWDEGVKAQCVAYDMRPDAGANPYREQGDSNGQ